MTLIFFITKSCSILFGLVKSLCRFYLQWIFFNISSNKQYIDEKRRVETGEQFKSRWYSERNETNNHHFTSIESTDMAFFSVTKTTHCYFSLTGKTFKLHLIELLPDWVFNVRAKQNLIQYRFETFIISFGVSLYIFIKMFIAKFAISFVNLFYFCTSNMAIGEALFTCTHAMLRLNDFLK